MPLHPASGVCAPCPVPASYGPLGSSTLALELLGAQPAHLGSAFLGRALLGYPSGAGSPFPWSWRGTAGGALPGCSLPAPRQAGIRRGQVLGPSCPARTQLYSPQLQASPMGGSCGPQSLLPPSPKTTPAFHNPFIYRNSTLKPHLGASTDLRSTAPAPGAPRRPCQAAGGRTAQSLARLPPSLPCCRKGVQLLWSGTWPRGSTTALPCPDWHSAGRRSSPLHQCRSWGFVRSSHSMVSSR